MPKSLKDKYQVIDLPNVYSREVQIPNLNGMFSGDLTGAAIRKGKFIDGAALGFIARQAGCIVTKLDGTDIPPLHTCSDYSLPGLLIATSSLVHQDLVKAAQNTSG